MADQKITDLSDGGVFQSGDEFVVARSGSNYKIAGSQFPLKLYDYTVSGSDKASIDTQVDDGGNGAAALPTTYSLLEIFLIARTDEAVQLSVVDFVFNNDTGSVYDRAVLVSTTADTSLSMSFAVSAANLQVVQPGSSPGASIPGSVHIVIPNYGGTTFHKAGQIAGGSLDSTSGNANRQWRTGGFTYRSTSAISRVKCLPDTSGKKFKIGTRLLIYARP